MARIILEQTTIRVKKDTKQCRDGLKLVEQESYDNLIRRLMRHALVSKEKSSDFEMADTRTRQAILAGIRDVRRGSVVSSKEMRKILFGKRVENSEVRKR